MNSKKYLKKRGYQGLVRKQDLKVRIRYFALFLFAGKRGTMIRIIYLICFETNKTYLMAL